MTAAEHFEQIDARRALELLEKAVPERGEDYVYPHHSRSGQPSCVYFEADGQPSCIVGFGLSAVGVTRAMIEERNDEAVYSLAESGMVPLSPDAVQVFTVAQEAQDRGSTWGEALRLARTCAAELGVTS